MEEIWKDILGYEGLYQVSNKGNVRSVDRVVKCGSRWGCTRELNFKGKTLTQFLGNNGYLKVSLSKDGHPISKDVHRLVYEAFNGAIDSELQVNHKDECKTNNLIFNLELLTPKDNTNYGTRNERMKETIRKRLQNK